MDAFIIFYDGKMKPVQECVNNITLIEDKEYIIFVPDDWNVFQNVYGKLMAVSPWNRCYEVEKIFNRENMTFEGGKVKGQNFKVELKWNYFAKW